MHLQVSRKYYYDDDDDIKLKLINYCQNHICLYQSRYMQEMELAKIVTVRIVVNFRKASYMYNYCIIIHACTCIVVVW